MLGNKVIISILIEFSCYTGSNMYSILYVLHTKNMELTVDIRKVYAQVIQLLRGPKSFFSKVKKDRSWKSVLPFVLVTVGVGHFFTAIYNLLVSPSIAPGLAEAFGSSDVSFSPVEVISAVVISYFLTVAMSLVWGGALKVWLMLFKIDSSFDKAYSVMAYSRMPNYLFGWIPFLNILAALYSLYLLVLGLEASYSVNRRRAVLVVASSLLAVFLLSFLILAVIPNI